MSESDDQYLSRKERRERTRSAILATAKMLFAEHGYEGTTIRAVAREVGVDPALVMQHFGSKDRLFAAAALSTVDTDSLVQAEQGDLAQMALEHIFADFEDPERRAGAVALLRSCLTHSVARQVLRDEVMGKTQAQVARTIGGEDAALRAAVLNASTLGLTIARYLLEDPVLAGASQGDIERVMLPALQAIAREEGQV
ncbi:TetR/AcrR family transcriptional regulator [Natronospirillum operosum]|uniref:TetR/AcrR family transcriptional regulator n=1 Tax=Natronospirillum operosum TaxID=2759953 RepID=A0A4Z0W7Y4_9GAMM|nr:TetR/AcrR family transcriptional regulator [Natronospirillum operosum]TGG91739.1 TetR/AcrR family transcriptional regulator [Natronospirillum operosum]